MRRNLLTLPVLLVLGALSLVACLNDSAHDDGTSRKRPATDDISQLSPPAKKPHLSKEDLWSFAEVEGDFLLRTWQDGSAPQSKFVEFSDLKEEGWYRHQFGEPGSLQGRVSYVPLREAFGALGLSYYSAPDKRSWSEDWEQTDSREQSSQLSPDGNAAQAKNGRYRTIIDVGQGAIVSVKRSTPADTGPNSDINTGGMHGRKVLGPFEQLWTWGDVAFLLWQDRYKDARKERKPLEWVFMMSIDDADTLALIQRALRDDSSTSDNTMIDSWRRCEISSWSRPGKAILASLAGEGVAEMLLTHRAAFDNRFVDRILLFRNLGIRTEASICIALHVADPSVLQEAAAKDGVSLRLPPPPVIQKSAGPSIDLTQEATSSQAALGRGKALLAAWHAGSSAQSSNTEFGELARWGWQPSEDQKLIARPVTIRSIFGPFDYFDIEIPKEGDPDDIWLQSGWKGSTSTTIDGQTYVASGRRLHFIMDTSHGVLVAGRVNNVAESARVSQEPPLYRWTDVAPVLWRNRCSKAGKEPQSVEWIFSARAFSALDAKTISLIKVLLGPDFSKLEQWPGNSFAVNSEEGTKLLGSDTVKDFAEMLLENRETFGNKFINRIILYSPRWRGNRWAWPSPQTPYIALHVSDSPDDPW